MTTFFAVRGLFSISVYYICSRYGEQVLAISRAALVLLFSPINAYILIRVLNIRIIEFIKIFIIPAFISIAVASISEIVGKLILNDVLKLVTQTTCYVLIIAGATMKFEPTLIRWKTKDA